MPTIHLTIHLSGYAAIELAQFFLSPVGKWSPAANLEHMIKSATPVAMALKLPKILLRFLFGNAQHGSRRIGEIKKIYLERLASGAKASGPYLPKTHKHYVNEALRKQTLLTNWVKVGDQLVIALSQWDEPALDKSMLPHPILGKLTVREMNFFTLYHYHHHVNNVEKVLKTSMLGLSGNG